MHTFYANSSYADIVTIIDNNKTDHFTISYLYDETSALTVNDVSKMDFNQSISNQFTLGYRDGMAWFKITIENNSPYNDFVLYFTEPFWSQFNLFKYQNNQWLEQKNGLSTSLEEREIRDFYPAFPLHIPSGTSKTIFIQGLTVSAHIGEFILLSKDEFFRPDRFTSTQFYTFYLGILSIIVLLNLFLFIAMRERLYAYYIAYVISFMAFISIFSGSYLSLGIQGWNEGLHAIGTLVVLFMTLFSGIFLELKERLPRIHRTFKFFAVIFVICTISITMKVPYSSLFFNLISSVFFTLLLITAIKVLLQGDIKARYYLIALVIYMPTMGMMTLTFNGLLENTDITRYAFLMGSFIEIIFFSILLVNRFHSLQIEKIKIQNELLIEKDKNEQYLENEIKKRTNELHKMNTRLSLQTRELEETKIKLTEESITDPLSTLYNRRYFSDISVSSFNNAQRYKQNLSIMMIDIDKFKNINDTYGHHVGDKVIISCAKTFKKLARKSDLIARYGGEEFIILVPQTALNDVLSLAERIREDMAQQVITDNQNNEIRFSLSIGVSQLNLETDTKIEQIIQRADKALYHAKNNGRNQVKTMF